MVQHNNFRPYRHFIWFAISYALILIGSFVVLEKMTLMVYAGTMIYSIIAATIVHFAACSVLGNGPLVKRTFVALAISMIVICGLLVGMCFLLYQDQLDDLWMFALTAGALIPPFLVAAQVPFWLLRGVFGWQFMHADEAPVSLSLKEMFLITLGFGIAFAMPRVVQDLAVDASTNLRVGETHYHVKEQEDGSVTMVETEITEENIDELKADEASMMASSINQAMLMYAIGFSVASLLAAPIIWCVLRYPLAKSIAGLAIYGFSALLIYCLISIAFFGVNYAWFQLLGNAILAIATVIGLIAMPLFVLRFKGITLHTGRVRRSPLPINAMPVDPLA